MKSILLILLTFVLSSCASSRISRECSPEYLKALHDRVASTDLVLQAANPQPDGDSRKNISTDAGASAAANSVLAQAELAVALDMCSARSAWQHEA